MEQTLGKRIMQHRKQLGLTQDQLAEKLGVTAQAVSKWENDQSCPDITMLPKLAELFSISVDALLGREEAAKTYEAEFVEEAESEGIHIQNGNWDIQLGRNKRGGLWLALLVIATGLQLLLAGIFKIEMPFWSVLWPTVLVLFGALGIYPRFSFFRIACLLFGSYFLLNNWNVLPIDLEKGMIFPIVLVLFGLSLLIDSLKKQNKRRIHIQGTNRQKNQFHIDKESFDYSTSFGENEQYVSMPRLSRGTVSASFGDYEIDLSGVESVTPDCRLDISCSFGELTIMVPRRYTVKLASSTTFAEISTSGHPDPQSAETIFVDANASFGEITIEYV